MLSYKIMRIMRYRYIAIKKMLYDVVCDRILFMVYNIKTYFVHDLQTLHDENLQASHFSSDFPSPATLSRPKRNYCIRSKSVYYKARAHTRGYTIGTSVKKTRSLFFTIIVVVEDLIILDVISIVTGA